MSFGLARGKVQDIRGFGLTVNDVPTFDEQPTLDPREWFDAPVSRFEIEIGSGKGTFLVQQAAMQTDTCFLGIEWAGEFFRYAADRVRRHNLANVRLLHGDAIEYMNHRFVPGIASVIHLYFPDPWPKKRHHKRRSVQDATLEIFHRMLTPQGEVRIVTDHEGYWQWMSERFARATHLFTQTPFERPESAGSNEAVGTNFERKYRREGRPFHATILRRVESSTSC